MPTICREPAGERQPRRPAMLAGVALAGLSACVTVTEPPVVEPAAPVAAAPSPSASAEEVAARVLEEAGGLEGWATLQGGHAVGRLRGPEGPVGDIEVWWSVDGRFRVRLELAPGIEVERGRDQVGAWTYDAARGGARVEAAGRPPVESFGPAAFLDPSGMRLDPDATLDGRTVWVFSRGETRWFVDPETHRILRVRHPNGVEVRLGTWERVDDLWIATELEVGLGDERQRVTYDSVELGAPSEAALSAPPEVPSAAPTGVLAR